MIWYIYIMYVLCILYVIYILFMLHIIYVTYVIYSSKLCYWLLTLPHENISWIFNHLLFYFIFCLFIFWTSSFPYFSFLLFFSALISSLIFSLIFLLNFPLLSLGLGSPFLPSMTVCEIVNNLLKYQGCFAEGNLKDSLSVIVERDIISMSGPSKKPSQPPEIGYY